MVAPSGDLAAAPVLNPPDSATTADAQIDVYLDAICLQIPAEVPAEALENTRLEMRAHLETAVAAYCELEQKESEAVQSALTQFGTPRAVAQHWQQEWTETLSQVEGVSVWPSLKTALRTWAIVNICAAVLRAAYLPIQLTPNITALHMLALSLMSFTALLGLPLLAGAIIGLRARRQPLLCTLGGNLLLLPLLVAGWTGANHWSHHYIGWVTGRAQSAPLSQEVSDAIASASLFLPTWVTMSLLGCSLALIGRHIKKRARRRQLVS